MIYCFSLNFPFDLSCQKDYNTGIFNYYHRVSDTLVGHSLRVDEVRQVELVDQIVERLRRWGMAGLAAILLEGMRPMAFFAGQMLWVAQPALSCLMDGGQVANYALLLEQPEAVNLLHARLEE